MKLLYILSISILTIFFTSCDETKKVIEVAGTVQLSGNYSVMKIGGIAAKGDTISISFAALDKSVKGNTGCNSFFGNYSLDAFVLNFGDMAVTERYCDEPIMETERAFLKALNDAGSYTMKDNMLTLYSKADRSILLTAKKATIQED
jgi:heat shock protein HslJ